MAAPSYAAAVQEAGATDAGGAWSFGNVSSSNGRSVIIQIFQDGSTSGAVALTTVSANLANLAGTTSALTSIGSFDVGSPTAGIQHLWIGRGVGTGGFTISGTNSTSEDLYFRAYWFNDISTDTTLAEIIENGPEVVLDYLADDGTTVSFYGITGEDLNEDLAQSFYSEGLVTEIMVRLKKVGNPTDNVIVTLHNEASGAPATPILSNLGQIAGSDMSTSLTDYTFSGFSVPKVGNTWIKVARSGERDNTNYYQWGRSSGLYSGGSGATRSSLIWTPGQVDRSFKAITRPLFSGGAGTSGTIADVGVTTFGPDRLALNFIALNDDNALADFTGETGGDWQEVAEYAEASGTDATIGLQTAHPESVGNSSFAAANYDIFGGSGTDEQHAQSFTVPISCTLTMVRLTAFRTGTPADNVVVEIQTNSSGVPSGTPVGTSASLAASSIATTGGSYYWTPNASLASGTTYWIVASRSGARDTSNYVSINQPAAGLPDVNNAVRSSGTWTADIGELAFGIATTLGGTIDGGTTTQADATDSWGVVGFALIGTTKQSLMPPIRRDRRIVQLI